MEKNNQYAHALANAAEMGLVETFESLLDMGVKIDSLNNLCLKVAISKSQTEIIKIILLRHEDLSVSNLLWALAFACDEANSELIDMVLHMKNNLVNISSCSINNPQDRQAPLERVLNSFGLSEKIEESIDVLIKYKCEVKEESIDSILRHREDFIIKKIALLPFNVKEISLTSAIENCNCEALKLLIEKGANINGSDWSNHYLFPLDVFIKSILLSDYSQEEQRKDMLKILLENGAKSSRYKNICFLKDMCNEILKSINKDKKDVD